MKMKSKNITVAVALIAASLSPLFSADARPARATKGAKYVFFFLGDGMANVQIQGAEAYLTHLNGGTPDSATDLMKNENILNMRKLPTTGMCTTFADTRFITGSAAAGTAFACGVKTDIGVIGRNTAKDISYKSIAELAQAQGKKIGIISSVSLPHATPAAYYANVNKRSSYNEIGLQASQSGFDFFGGGHFRYLDDTNNTAGVVLRDAFANAGYTFIYDREEIMAQDNQSKIICSVETSYDSDATPYAIDRPTNNVSLAEMTRTAIQCLDDDSDGFFIMVEGGKIDWAGHANDAVANILDTLAFDDAVGEALDFYAQHPNETLIVVNGDHETGGMTLGFKANKYEMAFDVLDGQMKSYDRFVAENLNPYKTNYFETAGLPYTYVKYAGYQCTSGWDEATMNVDQSLKDIVEANFGLVWTNLSGYQQDQLEAAFDRTMANVKDTTKTGYDLSGSDKDVDYLTYGGYEAFSVTLTHILNYEAGIVWTSSSHTGVPVPVMAIGFDAWRFNGFYDNTDIAKKLGKAMRTPALPVEDPARSGAINY